MLRLTQLSMPAFSRPVAGLLFATTIVLSLGLTGCGERARLNVSEGQGRNPALPEPVQTALPTLNIAKATGWPDGELPTVAAGLQVNAFATGLVHPRSLLVLPNNDVLVAETDSPPSTGGGIKAWIERWVMRRAGSGAPSANRIKLLRDADGDGVAEVQSTLLEGLNSPYGMALVGNYLYVANTDALLRFPYRQGQTTITASGERLTPLPAQATNRHWTKNLVASADGSTLYIAVGSNSNVAENGMEVETGRAAIHSYDIASGTLKLFATGLRNPVGMDFEPTTGTLWTAVNERDELGSDLVPDYMTSVQQGGFYGWPWSYFGQNVDSRVEPARPEMVAKAIKPDYALGPHTASLGLRFSTSDQLPAQYRSGAFVGQHGSWNRKPRSGYKVIYVPFENGQPAGLPSDVLTGFVKDDKALGRPVDVAIDQRGALLVSDDVGDAIWRVVAKPR